MLSTKKMFRSAHLITWQAFLSRGQLLVDLKDDNCCGPAQVFAEKRLKIFQTGMRSTQSLRQQHLEPKRGFPSIGLVMIENLHPLKDSKICKYQSL